MTIKTSAIERRRETRLESDDIIRWKRPGHMEDHKAWTIDQSPSGYGFMARKDNAPSVGEFINIRRYDNDRWDIFEEPFRVARTDFVTDQLVLVGCVQDEPMMLP